MKFGKVRNLTLFIFILLVVKFYLNNDKTNLGKFDAKSDKGIFLGYSNHSKAYRVYNENTRVVEESTHVKFDELMSPLRKEIVCYDYVNNEASVEPKWFTM